MVRIRKVALMGYPAVGKSSLASQFVDGRFEADYCSTIETRYTKSINISGCEFELQLLDTMGLTELPNFPDEYLIMDGYILVFSVDMRQSFTVLSEIYNKLRDAGTQKQPMVVVGNKSDLESQRVVPLDEAKALAKEFGALYMETSAKTNSNVNDVFKAIIMEIEKQRGEPIREKKDDCAIL
eukprot:m.63854 g.63854  ORF g.63854 m.63854 type:complete len:182 (+) comp13882_c0_seq1:155-700(+)